MEKNLAGLTVSVHIASENGIDRLRFQLFDAVVGTLLADPTLRPDPPRTLESDETSVIIIVPRDFVGRAILLRIDAYAGDTWIGSGGAEVVIDAVKLAPIDVAVTTRAECGDGIVHPSLEACDDHNTVDSDGCSSSCIVEEGYTCIGREAGMSDCYPTCEETGNNDRDPYCDDVDTDDDNDEVADIDDPAPNDPSRCGDADQDTCDDCALGLPPNVAADGPDEDEDGQCDAGDRCPRDASPNDDDDGDGVCNSDDICAGYQDAVCPELYEKLVLWLDADNHTTVSAYGNGHVTAWKDSRDRFVLTPLAADLQPTYSDHGASGRRVLSFKQDDELVVDINMAEELRQAAVTIMLVVSGQGLTKRRTFYWDCGDGLGRIILRTPWSDGNIVFGYGPSLGATVKLDVSTDYPDLTLFTFMRRPNGNASIFVNGQRKTMETMTEPLDVNRKCRLGIGPKLNGDCAEILLYNRALSVEERQLLEGYLAAKWNVTAYYGQ